MNGVTVLCEKNKEDGAQHTALGRSFVKGEDRGVASSSSPAGIFYGKVLNSCTHRGTQAQNVQFLQQAVFSISTCCGVVAVAVFELILNLLLVGLFHLFDAPLDLPHCQTVDL